MFCQDWRFHDLTPDTPSPLTLAYTLNTLTLQSGNAHMASRYNSRMANKRLLVITSAFQYKGLTTRKYT